MSGMFNSCSGLTNLDLSNFKTDNVTDMSSMFNSCSGLTSLNLSNFETDNVTDMSAMFFYCIALTSLDVSNFKTDNVTDMSSMFCDCRTLSSLDLNSFKTDNLINTKYMFLQCYELTKIIAPTFASALNAELPQGAHPWVYQPTGKTVTTITKAGTYIRSDAYTPSTETEPTQPKPVPKGTVLVASKITNVKLPASATFTVTSNDAKNPTVTFNGVSDKNATAVTIPKTITYNSISYKVTSVSLKSFSNTKENGKFKVTSNKIGKLTVEYTSPTNKKKTSISIPQYTTYKGIKFKVTSVAAKAFKSNKKVKKVTIPSTVTKIGKEAFAGCKNLKTITIKSSKLKSVGKNALKGINKKCKIKVPKAKLKAYKKLFNKKGQAKSVKITK